MRIRLVMVLPRLPHILSWWLAWPLGVTTAPTRRAPYRAVQATSRGAVIFALDDTRYLADAAHPVAAWAGDLSRGTPAAPRPDDHTEGALMPLTVVYAPDAVVTGDFLRTVVQHYREADDVFSDNFLEALLVARNGTGPSRLDQSAQCYLESLGLEHVVLDGSFDAAATSCEYTGLASFLAFFKDTLLTTVRQAVRVSPSVTLRAPRTAQTPLPGRTWRP